jgi:NAD(P)-dependent dehydrogenase (short-subunit alcohol dehydrogenase family)
MVNHISLITGGNAGIGRAAAAQLASRGSHVVIACRNAERGQRAVTELKRETGTDAVDLIVLDLSSRQSIIDGCDAFRRLDYSHLDVLIHNAADFDISRKNPVLSEDGIETVWATNHVGPVRMTDLLDAELSASSQGRVITASSQGLMLQPRLKVRLGDPEFSTGGFKVARAYYQSKLAQVMYTLWLASRYRGTARTANCVRVANVKVDLDRYPSLTDFQKRLYSIKSRFSISPEQMANVYTWLALAPEMASVSGIYFDHKRRQVAPSKWASNPDNIRRVMELTQRYVPELLLEIPSAQPNKEHRELGTSDYGSANEKPH